MFGPFCLETHRSAHGYARGCVLESGHDADHMDDHGDTWAPVGVTLKRLHETWGATHRFACTGTYWVATAHDVLSHWRTEIEFTPERLEESLRAHHGAPASARS